MLVFQQIERGKFSNLFSPEYKRTTFQLWVLWFGMAFFYYGMVLASAEILSKYSPDDNSKYFESMHYVLSSLLELFTVMMILFTFRHEDGDNQLQNY